MKHRVLLVIFKLLLFLVALCNSALSKHYHIVPVNSTDSACQDYQDKTCLTLEQLARSNQTSAGGTNLTLSFLPGEHLLTQSLAIHNFTHVQMNGMNESMVSFQGRARIEILHSNELHIKNMGFTVYKPADHRNHLQGLDISYSQTVYIVNCSIVGIDNQTPDYNDSKYHPSAIRMISNMNNVILDKIIAKGNLGRVVYIESQCNVTILGSEFTGNQGEINGFADLVYIYSTNTVISDSKFHSNIGGVLVIDSVNTFITLCDIANNIGPDNDASDQHYFSIVCITPHRPPGKLTDNSTRGCSMSSSYNVVTSDTAVHVGSKVSMNSSLLPTQNKDSCILIAECDFSEDCIFTQNSRTARTSVYHCIDISDESTPDLRNISKTNDIIYDFTTSNTSGSHGNRVRLCFNTHHQYTLPFINRVIFCDNETTVVIKEFETDTNQDNKMILTTERIGAAKKIKSSLLSIGADNTKNNPTAVIITSCTFNNNTSQRDGGAISMYKIENVLITFCSFTNNTSQRNGGAINMYKIGNVLVTTCSFTNNTSQWNGGAIYESKSGIALITFCSFTNNTSQQRGGAISLYTKSESTSENVLTTHCSFVNNTSQVEGGAIYISLESESLIGNVLIASCSFTNNYSKQTREGVWIAKHERVRISESNTNLKIVSSEVKANTFHIMGINLATVVQSTFTNSEIPTFYFEQSTITFLSGNLFSNNNGSVYAFNSKVTLEGSTIFSNNYRLAPICAVQSQIHFNSPEGITITSNTASLGGGIYLRESTMTVSHPIEISQNTADYGGGFYVYLSSIEFTSEKVNKQAMITNNDASQSGGGICAIASTIKISRSHVIIDSNTASANGGGMYLKQNSRVTLLKHNMEGERIHQSDNIEFVLTSFKVILEVTNNSAQFGGGIFVEDKTAGGSLSGGSATEIASISSSNYECFIQTIRLYEPYNPEYQPSDYFPVGTNLLNIFITNNTATISGNAIFGGLFDRCTISFQAEAKMFASNGLDYMSKIVAFESGIPPLGHNPLCDRE